MQASAQTSKMTNLSRKQVGRSQARNNGRAARKAVQFRPFSGSNNRLNTRTAAAAPETLGEVVNVELIDASTQSYAVTVDIGDGKKGVGTVTSAVVNTGDSVAIDILDAKTGALSINSVIPSNIKAALEARVAALKAAGIDTAELEALAASSGEAAEAAQKQALLAQADAKVQAALGEVDAEAAKAQGEALTAAADKLKAQYDAALKPLDDAALARLAGDSIGLRDELFAYLDIATEDLPYQPGQEVSGTVVSSHVNGVIVDLGNGVRGLLPTSDLKVPSAKTGAVPQDPLAVELKALLSAAKSGDEEAFQAAAAPILARREAILAEAQALLDEAASATGEELPVAEAEAALQAALAPETYQRISGQVKALEAAESGDAAAVTTALELINGPSSGASEEDDEDLDDDLDDEDNDADGDLDGAAYLDAESSDKLYGYQALRVSDASKIYSAGDSIDVYIKDTSSGYVLLSQYSPLEEKHTALVETARYIEDDMPELSEQLADEAFGGAAAAGIDIRPAFSEHAYAQAQLDALDAALASALSPAQKKRLDTIKETLLIGGGLSFADESFLASLSPILSTNTAVRELVGPLGAPEVETAALGADEESILAEIAAVAGEETAESFRGISASELYDISFEESEASAEASRILSLNSAALQAEIAKVLGVDSPDVPAADAVDILADVKAIEKAAGIDLAAEMKELFGDDADAVFETDLSALPDDIDFSAGADDDEEDLDLGEMGDLDGEDAAALADDARRAVAATEEMADRKYDLWDVAMDYAKGSDLVVDEGEIEIMELVEGNVDDEFAAALVDLDRVASEAISDDTPSTAGSGTVAAMHVLAASVGVSAAEVKALRDATGAGMMDCKKALIENGGDAAKATEYLRQKGLLSAGKKAGRVAAEGLIKMYVHPDARFGILLEVNCETDFVAGNDKFFELVNDLCVQLLPDPTIRFVSVEDVPPEVLAKEIEIEGAKEDLASKPEAMRAKIAEGRVQKNLKEQSLMEAKWWKDEKKTVAQVLKEAISTLGENIKIRRFQRITLGEGLAKKEDDLAKEVAAATQAQPKKEEPKKEEPKKEEAPKPAAPAAAVQVSAAQVKALRDATGAGMMDCKKALVENGGDATAATEWLRKKGLASAVKKAGRAAAEGLIVGYIHPDCRFGLVVEVNCETDFVAGNQKFYEFAQSIAVSIASNKEIQYVDFDDIPKDVLEAEKAAALANPDLEGKPEEIKMKIVEGRVAKAAESMCLMNQPFVYDPEKTVAEVVKETISTMGENIKIRRFLRYDLGSGIEKKQADLAAEVAAMTK